ncbi:MAG: enoyl-CoA hydratase/isomerase family protein [Deltaproteobacteria bacterium]|nr:enoyl-CoA hydratase/isomerase family protein [Deltaproteobacteria bacterium]
MSTLKKIGVVGAGNMGSGIAQKIAQSNLDVILVDTSEECVQRGLTNIKNMLQEGVARKIITPEGMAAVLGRVKGSISLKDLADADLVVEAIFEDMEVKKKLFADLDGICMPGCILGTNTSSFLIDDLAEAISRPDRFVGLHFFYHPAKNRLLEIIPGKQTSPETLAISHSFSNIISKTAIRVADAPGFAVNRFFVPWLNEAVRILESGGADIPTIEAAAKKALRIGMGPFELMNVTGPPITYHSAISLAAKLGPFYAPAARLKALIDANQKWDLAGTPQEAAFDQVSDRLIGVVFYVAVKMLEENVAGMADIDIGAKVGLRWALGPFELMNKLGIDKSYQMVSDLCKLYDDITMPAALTDQYQKKQAWDLKYVYLTIDGPLAVITINRPEAMNALNPTVVNQLEQAVDAAEANAQVAAIVLQGAGKAFVAGADISFFVKNIKNDRVDDIVAFATHGQKVLNKLDDSKKRVIVKLDGLSLGGGSELALAADIIVATPNGSLGFPETGIGIFPGLGGTHRTAWYLGRELARYLVLTGQVLDAKSAQDIGLVEYLCSPAEIDAKIRELATAGEVVTKSNRGPVTLPPKFARIKELFSDANLDKMLTGQGLDPGDEVAAKLVKGISFKAPLAVQKVVQVIDEGMKLPDLKPRLQLELDNLQYIFSTADALEGLSTVGRKKPSFVGK